VKGRKLQQKWAALEISRREREIGGPEKGRCRITDVVVCPGGIFRDEGPEVGGSEVPVTVGNEWTGTAVWWLLRRLGCPLRPFPDVKLDPAHPSSLR
jgi:hypothetical protein